MITSENLLPAKLEELFDTARKPDGSRYTQSEVVEGTQGKLSRVYLWKLRTGRAANPGYLTIKALAEFFGVDTDYFSKGAENPARAQNPTPPGRYFEDIKRRALQMDDQAQKAILDLMDYLLTLQKDSPEEEK